MIPPALMLVIAIGVLIATTMLVPVLGLRSIEGDEHYGWLGAGTMAISATNVFSAAILPEIIEPDFIVKTGGTKLTLEIDVKDVLVWDAREWQAHTTLAPDIVGGEQTLQQMEGGLTKDNTVNGNDAPTADSVAQGTIPGGNGVAITGASAGGPGTAMNGDEQPTRFVDRWSYMAMADEEQTAVGQILWQWEPVYTKQNEMYDVDGNSVHYLMTAAHYHMWGDSLGMATQLFQSLGFSVRRMSVDLKELMFDRAVILSILDALVVSG